jgi:HAD superfamily hydrolase (TIGR01509 family)
LPNSPFPDKSRIPSAVLFDLGGVFVDVRVEDGLAAFRRVRPELDSARIRGVILDDGLLGRYERGLIGSRAFYAEAVSRLGTPISFPDFSRCWGAMLAAPDRRMTGFLRSLAGRVLRVALSNTNALHIRFLERRSRLLGHFDRRVYSYECGFAKPERGIYLAALHEAGAEPGSCLFVDDREENVRAAERIGIPSVRFEGTDAFFSLWADRFGGN